MKRLYNKYIDFIFIKEKMNLKPQFLPMDLLLVVIGTILCIIFVLTPVLNDTVFRILFDFIFILFAPGYSLIAALFPKKDDLKTIERITLSIGLSIAVTSLIGFLLNYTPFGIILGPILLCLSVFTILMSIVAYIRRCKLLEDERFSANFKYHFNRMVESLKQESGKDRILSIVLVISMILAVATTAYVIVVPKGEKFTEFYILGPKGMASDYPTNLTAGESGNVTVGIENHEYSTVNYEMVIKLNNQTIDDKNITLSNNQTYLEPFKFIPYSYGQNHELEFLLYKLPDTNNVYRSLHLWLNIN